jgi:hypothetical protein
MTVTEATDESWLAELRRHVEARPCVLLRLNESDSDSAQRRSTWSNRIQID